MKTLRALLLGLTIATAAQAQGETPCVSQGDSKICLPKEDFQRFLDIAIGRQCLDRTRPVFEVDGITILTDREGRVFYTGADPKKPYTLHMKWCHYEVEAQGTVHLIAAMQTPQTSGIRFRPKAYLGYLPLKLSKGKFSDGVDAGLLIDWLFIHEFNLNLAAGFRSVGMGVGLDLTSNFGLMVGYALGWTAPLHNVNTSVYFAF